MHIGTRRVGPGEACFVIAEAGVNHNGDPALARDLIRVAAEAGADAVKFQTYRAEYLATAGAPKAAYQASCGAAGESQLQMLERLELPRQAYPALVEECTRRRIIFLSTPFDEDSADFLERLGMVAFKIASGEATNLSLLAHIAKKRRPMIVSTGMCDLGEVANAVRVIRAAGARGLALLHCVSNYPAAAADANLKAMATLERRFRVPVGYSDHVMGAEVSLAAVALGACIIEKHFTTSRALPGPDQKTSMEPAELAALVRGIRAVESALGDGIKRPARSERPIAAVVRRSLVAARDIARGTVITEALIALRRPGTGLPPGARPAVVGRRARRDIPAGTLLSKGMFR